MDKDEKIVKVDDRGRISLVGFNADGHYRAVIDRSTGVITLRPMEVTFTERNVAPREMTMSGQNPR